MEVILRVGFEIWVLYVEVMVFEEFSNSLSIGLLFFYVNG